MLFKHDPKRKVKVGLLIWKSIVYRILIIGLQTIVTYFFIRDLKLSFGISVIWNIINAITYFLYDWVFSANFEVRVGVEK
ncbi:MAG: DUF2061 domain-containing protein [Candidatus Woesearchaeota archaeon]|nr:MAG: DUF2061 domain-containing protein [Candidatus Woesearchaeota archaeon]